MVAAAGLAGCGGGSGGGTDARAPTTTGPPSTAGPGGSAPAGASTPAVDCGAAIETPPELDDDQVAVLAELTDGTGLPEAPPYTSFRVVCDSVGATSAAVPRAWGDELPRPSDPPQSSITVGPDLTSRVEDAPVVGVGAGRYDGDRPAASFVNDNNAAGSLENGARTLPRRGDAIPEGCTPLDPVRYRAGAYQGEIQPFARCDGEARAWLVAAAFPDDGGQYQTQLVGQALTTADLEALVRTLVSLRADPVHVPGIRLPPLPALGATS